MISAAEWLFRLCKLGVPSGTATAWSQLFEKYVQPEQFGYGADEMADFLGQILHESAMLTRLEENLDYRAQRIIEVWPTRFATLADAAPYAHMPQALANKVYGGRYGNTELDDGWKFRARGLIGVTFKDNYRALSNIVGIDFVENPDLLAQPASALLVAKIWWAKQIPLEIVGNVAQITRVVNGGANGLTDRVALTDKARDQA